MTRYTVVWLERSQDQLAQIWVNSSDRQAITEAANNIDSELANDPETKGVKDKRRFTQAARSSLNCALRS
jgi:hypothetical protein